MSEFEIEPVGRSQPAPQRYSPPQRCSYCNAPLNAFFYFCTGCGMPYKDVTAVLSAEIPRQLSEGELVRMKAPAVWPMFWSYLAVIIVSSILAMYLFVEDQPELAVLLQMGAMFVTTCVFAAMYWPSLSTQFARLGFGHLEAWIALAILVPMLGLNWAWSNMWIELLRDTKIEPMDWKDKFGDPLFRILAIAVFPAIVEEIAFRGLIQHWLQTALKPWRAIILASFLFAILHFSVAGLPYLFLVGMLLGWAKWKTGSLYPSMLIHFLHNYVAVEFL